MRNKNNAPKKPVIIDLKANKPAGSNFKVNKVKTWQKTLLRHSSHILLTFMALCIMIPFIVSKVQKEASDEALILAIAEGNKLVQEQEERAARLNAVMKEFNAFRLTLYCEAKNGNRIDMEAIADNVLSRVDSDKYPDTIYEVVNEVRKDAKTGKLVAMYSYINTDCPASAKSTDKWQLAGVVSALAMKDHWDGKPSSGNVNYIAPYANAEWKVGGVQRCELTPVEIEGAYHLFFAEVDRSERSKCLAERRKNEQAFKAVLNHIKLPKHGPIPAEKPQTVAELLASKSL